MWMRTRNRTYLPKEQIQSIPAKPYNVGNWSSASRITGSIGYSTSSKIYTSQFNVDGSGYLASGSISWNNIGNVSFQSNNDSNRIIIDPATRSLKMVDDAEIDILDMSMWVDENYRRGRIKLISRNSYDNIQYNETWLAGDRISLTNSRFENRSTLIRPTVFSQQDAEHNSNIYIREGQVQLESRSNNNIYTYVDAGSLYVVSNSVRMSLFEISGVLHLTLKGLPTTAPTISGAVWRDSANGNVLKIVP